MPKVVDHDERRRHIATAVSDIAATRGLTDVSFREVAARAGVSVSLVQHYFGNKANLLRTTLEIQSEAMSAYIAERLVDLGADPDPIDILRTVARAFLPLDDASRRSMLLYHGFAAAALTDPALRGSDMFSNGRGLIDFFATQLAHIRTGDGSDSPRSRCGRDRPFVAPSRALDRCPPRTIDPRRRHRRPRRPPRPPHQLTVFFAHGPQIWCGHFTPSPRRGGG